jgi:hypothetical protein
MLEQMARLLVESGDDRVTSVYSSVLRLVPLPKLSPGAAATLLYGRKVSTCPLELQRP